MAFANVQIQDLTYTEKQYGLKVHITYTNNGIAGAEEVSVTKDSTGRWDIIVKIESGVSTATQIKAAIDAHIDASWLVSVAITGTGSTAQVSCVNATLLGGTVATNGSKSFGSVLLAISDDADADANSIRFKLVGGGTAGSEVVTVASTDVSVEIEDGVSTWSQIKTAIDNDAGAAALIDVSSDGSAMDQLAYVASAPSFINLTGGNDATAASIEIQDLTITSINSDATGNGKAVTYTTGATAASEVVTVDEDGNVEVQIENGVSTATQIKAALDAESDFTDLYTCTISGTAGNAQNTVNNLETSGAS